MTGKDRLRLLVGVVLTLAIVVPLGWMWWGSRMPASYSVMDMGEPDWGGGPQPAQAMGGHGEGHGEGHGAHVEQVSVADLDTEETGPADVVVDLEARQGTVRLASGEEVEGYTFNGTSPGPTITATVGQLVEVRLHNEDVEGGVSLHWHGVDVPNAQDGVTGVTQDAVGPGEDHVYRWVAPHEGTFWYHSHQLSHDQVVGGLLGGILIRPAQAEAGVRDALVLAHQYRGKPTLNGSTDDLRVPAAPGERVRVRVVNTDNGTGAVWSSAAYRLRAVDGYDVHEPTPVEDRYVALPAGGKADLEVVVPDEGAARVGVSGGLDVLVGPEDAEAPVAAKPERRLDLLAYGSPTDLPFDAADPDRRFSYEVTRRPGFVMGKPGMWWAVNGKLFPHIGMAMVQEGDVVRMRIANDSNEVHPMHLHGHHGVVLERDGEKATGSPWWFDSLEVRPGEEYVVTFLADNPGIWMDHCHNLKHAAQGMVSHLMYAGVTTPYRLGEEPGNLPE